MPIGRYWQRVVSGIRRFPDTGRLRFLERDLADAQAALIVGDVVAAQTALLRARADLVELREAVSPNDGRGMGETTTPPTTR